MKNRAIDEICRFLKQFKSNELNICFRKDFGTPVENTQEFKELFTEDFDAIRNRTDDVNLFIGRFFGLTLLIESKLTSLLKRVDSEIEDKLMGKKIDILKDLLRELRKSDLELDHESFDNLQALVGPLREITRIRNEMAHNLRYVHFNICDIRNTVAAVRKYRPDWGEQISGQPSDGKTLAAISFFAFIFFEEITHIRHILE